MCTTGRLFHCLWCCEAVVICRSCDRNHQYCSPACRSKGRTQNRREAQRRYNKTENGRLKNAKRQQACRQRLTDKARKIAQMTKSTMAASMRLVLGGIQRHHHARSKKNRYGPLLPTAQAQPIVKNTGAKTGHIPVFMRRLQQDLSPSGRKRPLTAADQRNGRVIS